MDRKEAAREATMVILGLSAILGVCVLAMGVGYGLWWLASQVDRGLAWLLLGIFIVGAYWLFAYHMARKML